MEVVGVQSPRFEQDRAHFLHRDGLPITAAGRRFWDFRDPWVIDYLSQKVIGQLRDNGLGYIKVDYNETIGIGCDSALPEPSVAGRRPAPAPGRRAGLLPQDARRAARPGDRKLRLGRAPPGTVVYGG